jgi:L-gulonolactone oxidase
VTADGEVLDIDETDERFDAIRVSLGLMGVISTVTLRVTDAFRVRVKGSRIPEREWKRVLTDGDMSHLLWFPHTGSSVLIRVDTMSDPAASAGVSGSLQQSVEAQGSTGPAPDFNKYRRALSELANLVPATFPARNRYFLDVLYPEFEAAGPAHQMLMSFRSDPIAGAEWAVPVSRFDAVFEELQREISNGDFFLPIVWLKKVKAESAWLGSGTEDSIQCGIYHDVIEGTPSLVKQMVTRVERMMLKYGGRPHLAKLIYLSPSELKQLYPEWHRFNALREELDPEGMFWTDAIEARFGARMAAGQAAAGQAAAGQAAAGQAAAGQAAAGGVPFNAFSGT